MSVICERHQALDLTLAGTVIAVALSVSSIGPIVAGIGAVVLLIQRGL